MKAKDINIYSIYSLQDLYKKKDVFFYGLSRLEVLQMSKVDKPIRQVSNVYQFPIHQYYNQKRRVK